MAAYGQVYRTSTMITPDDDDIERERPHGLARVWRGIIMDEGHRTLWRGLPKGDPDWAYDDMVAAAEKHGYPSDDLRRWSGDINNL